MGYLSVFSPNAEKCEKNTDQNNYEYERFLHSDRFTIFGHINPLLTIKFKPAFNMTFNASAVLKACKQ